MGIVVDNFAGGGGASTAMEQALGRHVDIAINHDADAIRMHKRNHPDTEHYCESVWDVEPVVACRGRAVDVAWFSPDCKHFSRAAGGKPKNKNIRALAWVVLKWAELPAWQRPRVIFLENVSEFLSWGPLTKKGKLNKRLRGTTFFKWRKQLHDLDYITDYKLLVASDYGAPTIRKRLFIVARCDRLPITWPAPTHGDPKKDMLGVCALKPWKPASSIIDWSVPCKSIFEREQPLAENTMKRIAAGLKKFVIDNPEPFIVKVNHKYDYFRGQSLDQPLQTITSKLGSALVVPVVDAQYGASTGRSAEEPLGSITANGQGKQAIIAPVIAPFIDRQFGAATGDSDQNDITQPLGAVTAQGGGGKSALVTPCIQPTRTTAFIAQHNTGVVGRCADAPLSSITVRGTQQQVVTVDLDEESRDPDQTDYSEAVSAFLIKYYGNEKSGCDLAGPLHSVTSKDRFGLVMVHGQPYRIVDICMRMLTPRELFNAQGFPPDYDIMEGELTKTAQVAKAGNAVSPPPAIALIRANAEAFITQREAA